MSIKRMSLRFNLDNEFDRRAWEHLQSFPGSRNKAAIDALNAFFEQADTISDLIRETSRECLTAGPFVPRIFHLKGRNRRSPKTKRRFLMQWMPSWEPDGMKVMPLFTAKTGCMALF